MKEQVKRVILGTSVLRSLASLQGPSAAILMFHSVRQDPGEALDLLGGIAHSEAVFRGQMELLAHAFRPISLDELAERMRAGRQLPRRSVIVTFDDGYADNYETTMPILNQIGVPAIFYVTVDCIEKHRLPWPARLRFSFRRTRKASWRDPEGKEWDLLGKEEREQAFVGACEMCCRLTGALQDNFVVSVEAQLDACAAPEAFPSMMTYDQLRDLTRYGHIVGSHTMTHPNLAYVSAENAKLELTESKKRLEQQLGSQIRHFSYPCPALSPHWNDFSVDATRKAGYETAVTTDWGLTRVGDDLLRLKRVLPTKTVEGLRWNLECAFAGQGILISSI